MKKANISANLSRMFTKMEESELESERIAGNALRQAADTWALDHACYRCSQSVWGTIHSTGKSLDFGIKLSACRAFTAAASDENFPDAPFYCSAESSDSNAVGFAALELASQHTSHTGAQANSHLQAQEKERPSMPRQGQER